jgi:anti-sigma regulatory factor (Ser/Thr protein kinase)
MTLAMGSGAEATIPVTAAIAPTHVFFRLRMPSRRAAVAPMAESILQCVAPSLLDAEQKANLTVALSEALSNGVVHGNRLRPQSPVLVAGCVEPGRGVVIDVRDFGAGFNVSALLDPCDAERVLAPSGRGIFLMRHLVDSVSFNARGNRVRLTVRSRAGR